MILLQIQIIAVHLQYRNKQKLKTMKKTLSQKQIKALLKKVEKQSEEQKKKDIAFISKHGVNQINYWG